MANECRSRCGQTCGNRGSNRCRIRSAVRCSTLAQAVNGPPSPRTANSIDPPSAATRRRRSSGRNTTHRVGLLHQQRLAPRRRWTPPRTLARQRASQAQVAVHPGQRLAGDPGRAELAALGHPSRHRERDRHLCPTRRQRRDLHRQQERELLPAQPGRQREPPHRGVAGQLPPPVRLIASTVRAQPRQAEHQQPREVRLQILDRHVWFRPASYRQVDPPPPDLIAVDRGGLPVGERLRGGTPLPDRPPIQIRQDAHVLRPRRGLQPHPDRATRPVRRVRTQQRPQPLPALEQPDTALRAELRPVPNYPRVRRPRPRGRATTPPAASRRADPACTQRRAKSWPPWTANGTALPATATSPTSTWTTTNQKEPYAPRSSGAKTTTAATPNGPRTWPPASGPSPPPPSATTTNPSPT